MSKYLTKLLSICAFVVLLPLIIAGSALCVTEARSCTLTVADGGVGEGKSSKVQIIVEEPDRKEETETSLSLKKNTKVTVTYTGEGYDFVGWYAGSYDEINRETDKPLSTQTSYTFYVRKNTVVTAVRDVQQYTVTYTGEMNDGSALPEDVNGVTEVYTYGSALKELQSINESDYVHAGWKIVAAEGEEQEAVAYKNATFPVSGEYTVEPVWEIQKTIKYLSSKEKDAITIAEETITLKDISGAGYSVISGQVIDNYLATKPGYKFDYWMDVNGNKVETITEFNSFEIVTLYIKISPIEYSLTVNKNPISVETFNISYNIEKGFVNDNDANITRTGYNYKGLLVNEITYVYDDVTKTYATYPDGAKLSDALFAGKAESINAVAVWDCKYSDFQ